MIIDKLNINKFGKFNNTSFSFNRGLNVIYGKNESGKTTLLDFIVFMLYGADKRQKDDLFKYKPRDGANMHGSMEYFKGDSHFAVQRTDVSQNSVRLINTDTGCDAVLNGALGAELFGFGVEAFKKTYYSGNITSVICDDKTGSIADRISNLSKQNQGEATFSQIKKHLTTKINSYTSKRCESPVIPTLEESLYPAQKNADNALLRYREAMDQKAKLPLLIKRLNELNEKLELINKKRESLNKLRLNEEYEKLSDKINNCESILSSNRLNVFNTITSSELELFGNKGADILNTCLTNKIKHNASYKITACISALFFVLSILFWAMHFKNIFSLIFPLAFSGLLLVSGISAFTFKKLSKRAEAEHEKFIRKTAHFLGETDISSAGEFLKLYDEWKNQGSPDSDDFINELEILRNKFDTLVNNIKTKYELSEIIHLDKNAISYDNISEEFYDDGVLNQTLRETERLKLEISGVENLNPDSYLELYEKAKRDEENISKQLKNAKAELKVYTKALEILERANAELENVFAPRVCHFASEVFNRLTGSRYDTITINSKLNINVKDNLAFYDASNFSTATKEQMYLALRLAVTELCSPEKLPVFLDDCLSYYDDERKRLCFEFLKDFSKDRQIIYLTCHKAELDLAIEMGANIIYLV